MSTIKDVFAHALEGITAPRSKEEKEIEEIVTKLVTEKGLVAHPPWMLKAIELYQLSTVHHGKGLQLFQLFVLREGLVSIMLFLDAFKPRGKAVHTLKRSIVKLLAELEFSKFFL